MGTLESHRPPRFPPLIFHHQLYVLPSQTPAQNSAIIPPEWTIQNSARLQRRFRNCRNTSFGNLSQFDVLAEPISNHGPANLFIQMTTRLFITTILGG